MNREEDYNDDAFADDGYSEGNRKQHAAKNEHLDNEVE